MSPFCRFPAALLLARQQSFWGSPPVRVPNPTTQLGCWKPLHLVSTRPKASAESHARFRKELVWKKIKKNAEDRLMNTYAIVIKLFRLHCALFFIALFLFSSFIDRNTFPTKGQNRLACRGTVDCTKAIRDSKTNFGHLYCAAPVPAAMHICLASAHYRWLGRWYGVSSTV